MHDLHEMAAAARAAYLTLASADASARNSALLAMADALLAEKDMIFNENAEDVRLAQEGRLAVPLLKRLAFGEEKLSSVVQGLRDLAALPDPLGHTTLARELTEGLNLYRVTCPIGVIGVIFESRPDALVQIASLALKSGNAVLLKGGSEAARTNLALCNVLRAAAEASGLPADFAQLLTSREEVSEMLREDDLIDLIIPRGSKAFVRYIMDNSRIPVLGHADGICHVYIDQSADPEMALHVAVDSKVQNVSVCNAMETLLIHRAIAPSVLPALNEAFTAAHVSLVGDDETVRIIHCAPAQEEDWRTEYLDYRLSIRIVDSLDAAINHINTYGSHHTDCIVTADDAAASEFLRRVDSAGVYRNVSTRFADGFVYGFGAEVGIATGKIHARGPMGVEGLTTYKYKLLGSGQTMSDVKAGRISYTHRDLEGTCPI